MTDLVTRPAHRRRRHVLPTALALAGVTALAACGGDSFDAGPGDESGAASSEGGAAELQVLIASSGDAETDAVTAAAQAWAEESGNAVEVLPAQDINQELSQGFAGGSPPDVFYVDAGAFGDYAANGNLHAYLDELPDAEDFYPSLLESFTYDDTRYCAPKDYSTLALQINTGSWEAAGLGDDDIPTTWDELRSVAEQLTTDDQAGLVIGQGRDRVGAFLVQNGGWWLDPETGGATDTQEADVAALEYVQELLASDVAVLPTEVDAGWGGEAFGTERAAMTIEGNWIRGAMRNDYPDVDYTVAELPRGPEGQGTLLFTQCWGIAADSPAQAAAVDLVEYLTTPEQQITFADAFGVMPSRQAAEQEYVSTFPDDAPFVAGAAYGRGPVNQPGLQPALADLDSQLEQLESASPEQILTQFRTNAEAALQ